MAKPYATLSFYGQKAVEYYVRLNGEAAKLLKGLPYVKVGKTKDNKYIVIEPSLQHEGATSRKVSYRGRKATDKAAYVFVTQWVSMSFFPTEWFSGEWRKVKKDRHGRIYVCLDELIERERKE